MTQLPRAWDAVVLAGGRGTRLGGVRKPELQVAGRTLLDHALDAVDGARSTVVVGPADLPVPAAIGHTQEEPAFGGPVAALAAGLAELPERDGWVLLLAADLPRAEEAVAALAGADFEAATHGVCLRDPDGRWQWLAGVYRRSALESALGALPTVRDASLRRLLGPLRLQGISAHPGMLLDVDTKADLEVARSAEHDLADSEERPRPRRTEQQMNQDLPPIQEWVRHACTELGVDPELVDLRALLDMTRDVAHHVDRPAAPVTAYLVGLAVASRASASPETVRDVVSRAGDLARNWEKERRDD
ncbi:DUF6457 domain-containing protein [Ruania alba]|uniref:DUF6457 domain-containing protein n=1 Tax=Ruania alba TaxID=648782 RepID=UPI0015877586|nr:DUF6457 domain-containing protein [Ruania alba]